MQHSLRKPIRTNELSDLGLCCICVKSKPYFALMTGGIIGLALMIWSLDFWWVGTLLLLFVLVLSIFGKDETVFQGYTVGFATYENGNKKECRFARWEEVCEWLYTEASPGYETVTVKLTDHTFILIRAINVRQVIRCFRKFVPEYEYHEIQKKKLKNTPFKWPWSKQ